VAFYLGASAFLTYGVDWVYEKLSRSSSLERREGEKENLRDRAGELLRRISQKCGTP
jgi:hypothetical protein